MSYGISIVAIKPKENETTVNYACMGGFDGMHWFMHKDDPKYIKKLNAGVILSIRNVKGKTTLERLLTAPVDSVILLDEDSFTTLEGFKPQNNTKGEIKITPYLEEGIDQN